MSRKHQIQEVREIYRIPVFPHVKKFILKLYGNTEPVKIHEYNSLGKLVTMALQDKRMRADQNDQQRDRVTDSITIVLNKEQSELGVRLGKLMRINTSVDTIFKEHLLTWIEAMKKNNIAPYTACRSYLHHYGIDDGEYSLDAAYKFYQRTQKGR